ncbi:MAG: serine hydrolase [bacterium]|nr:serine hydrolase [bacterium]
MYSRNLKSFRRQIIVFLALALIIASAFYANALNSRSFAKNSNQSGLSANQIITTNLRQIERDDEADLIAINQPGAVLGDSEIFASEEEAQELLEKENQEKEAAKPKVETPFAVLAVSMDGTGPRFAKNAEKRWPIASITKLMTAVVVLENFAPTDTIMVSQDAEDMEGVSGDIKTGEVYTIEHLIEAIMTVSSNDAAGTIANRFGMDNFKNMMQEKAYEIGMSETTFMEPTGLSYLNQSSAEDTYKLVRYVFLNHPQVLEYSTHRQSYITEQNSGQIKILNTINQFAGREDFLGGKTGYTDEAKGNLVSVFKDKNGLPVVIVVLGSENRFDASLDAFAKYQELLAQ